MGIHVRQQRLRCKKCAQHGGRIRCSHCADCSDCIRQQGDLQSRSLGSRKCPECRAPWQESHLEVKAVHSLAVAVKAFQSAKPQIMDTVQQQTIENPASTSSDGHLQPHSRKRSRQNSAECNELAEQIQPTGDGKLSGASTAGEVPPKSAAEKAVPPGCGCCPMCNRVFSMRFLASHVNSCLISTEAADPSAKAGDVQKKGGDSVVDLTDPAGASPHPFRMCVRRGPCTDRVPVYPVLRWPKLRYSESSDRTEYGMMSSCIRARTG